MLIGRNVNSKEFVLKKLLLIIAASFPWLMPPDLGAELYVYEDAQGVKHYTNVPTDGRYKPVRLGRINNEPKRRPVVSRATGNPAWYKEYIQNAATTNDLDPLLIKAIIKVESDFDQNAVSSSGAQGLMQLMPETASDMRVINPFDPQQNINGGSKYFKKLLGMYDNNLKLSLAAYNAGPSKVPQNGPIPRIKETKNYVSRVIKYYHSYQETASANISDNIRVQKMVTIN